MKRHYICAFVLNLSLMAQETSTYLRGEVVGSSPTDHLFVEVYEQNRRMMIDRVPVLGDGRFEVSGAQSGGHYEMRIVRPNGEKLQSEGGNQLFTSRFHTGVRTISAAAPATASPARPGRL